MGDCRFPGKFVVNRLSLPFSLLPERLIQVLQRRIAVTLELGRHEMVLRGRLAECSRERAEARPYMAAAARGFRTCGYVPVCAYVPMYRA
jgi:hypothetical protein